MTDRPSAMALLEEKEKQAEEKVQKARKPSKPKRKSVSLDVSEETRKKIKILCALEGKTMKNTVIYALNILLKKHDQKPIQETMES